MKTIIAGSRGIHDYALLCRAVANSSLHISRVLSGHAPGVDRLGERWALENDVPCRRYLPEWDRYGTEAGFRRNEQMAKDAEALIAVWDGHSRGTAHMVKVAQQKRLKVFIMGSETRLPFAGGRTGSFRWYLAREKNDG